ncbi:MAG: cell division protein ZapA [Oscillospiraceae bacterium]|nr:cell division protein ZapA [Oscillospiraceae bacterium]
MANRVTMSICGQEYTLVAEENAAYMEKVGELVDKKMAELMDAAHVGRSDAAVLAAVNLADDLFKAQDNADNLRRQLKAYLDEISDLKRQLFKAQNKR